MLMYLNGLFSMGILWVIVAIIQYGNVPSDTPGNVRLMATFGMTTLIILLGASIITAIYNWSK